MAIEKTPSDLMRRADTVVLPPSESWTYAVAEPPERAQESAWIWRLVGLVRRRKWAFVGGAAAGILIGLAATLAITPVYRAHTSLQLEGFNDSFLRDVTPISPLLANSSADNYVRNQLKVLQSDGMALRVAEKLAAGGQAPPPPPPTSALRRLGIRLGLFPRAPLSADQPRIAVVRAAMNARVVPQSHIIEISFDGPDPDSAAQGANLVAAEFIALNRETRWQVIQDATEWLTRQTADLKGKLEEGNRRLQEFARTSGLAFTGGQQTLAQDRMRQLQDALSRAEADRAARQSRYEAALSRPGESLPDLLVTGPLRQYQTDLQALRRQLAELKAMYTPAHYRVKRVEAQIAELESAIAAEKQAVLERLKTDYDASARLERLLAGTNQRQLVQLQAQAEKEAQYNFLRREVESTQQMYESMLQKAREAAIASALRSTNIRVIDPARAPSLPHSPNLPLNLAGGLAFGMLAGLGLALFRERSGVVRQPGDTIALNLPELGVIPSLKDDHGIAPARRSILPIWRTPPEVALITLQNNNSLMSESFRAALASILLSSEASRRGGPDDGARGRVLVVTSSDALEGKTTVLTNLGVAVAETRARVLLIDGDLRKPQLHKIFDVPNDRGICDMLSGQNGIESADLDHLARPTSVPNLWLLPSGPDTKGIGTLLYSDNLKALLRRLRTEFDLVLIDTPPMAIFPDARLLGRLSDGVVLVIRANRARTDALGSICRRLSQDNIPVLGTILNDWRMEGSQSRSYGTYYRRYHHTHTS